MELHLYTRKELLGFCIWSQNYLVLYAHETRATWLRRTKVLNLVQVRRELCKGVAVTPNRVEDVLVLLSVATL